MWGRDVKENLPCKPINTVVSKCHAANVNVYAVLKTACPATLPKLLGLSVRAHYPGLLPLGLARAARQFCASSIRLIKVVQRKGRLWMKTVRANRFCS